jgi:hypothetical protein
MEIRREGKGNNRRNTHKKALLCKLHTESNKTSRRLIWHQEENIYLTLEGYKTEKEPKS